VGEGEGKKGEAYDLKNPNQGEKPRHLALTSYIKIITKLPPCFHHFSASKMVYHIYILKILIKYDGTGEFRGAC